MFPSSRFDHGRRARRTALSVAAIAAITLSGACASDEGTAGDKGGTSVAIGNAGVAAEAAGQKISTSSLEEAVTRGLKAEGVKLSGEDLTRQTLARKIRLALVRKEADRLGIKITPELTAATRAELEKQTAAGGGLVKAAGEQGIAEADLGEIVEFLTYQKLTSEKLSKDNPVTDAELKSIYEDPKNQVERVQVSHILVKDKALADKLLKEIAGGADFAALAQKHSTDPGSKVKGGDLGPTPRGQYVREFEDVVWTAEVGKVSQPVKTQFGYHLIKVTKRSTFAEVKEELRLQAAGKIGNDRLLESIRKAGAVTVNPRYGKWDDNAFDVVAPEGDKSDPSSPQPDSTGGAPLPDSTPGEGGEPSAPEPAVTPAP